MLSLRPREDDRDEHTADEKAQEERPATVVHDVAAGLERGAGRLDDHTCTWGSGLVLTAQTGATPNIRSVGGLSTESGMSDYLGIGANTNYGSPAVFVCEFSIQ